MPRLTRTCDIVVKQSLYSHRKCSKTKKCAHHDGVTLNSVLQGLSTPLEEGREYRVCGTINDQVIQILRDRKKQKCSHRSSDAPIRLSNDALFVKNILFNTRSYRRRFVELKDRERTRRSTQIANTIISGCVDREQLFVDGGDYLFKNKELAVDIVALLDSVKLMIQKKIKYNLATVTNSNPSQHEEEDTPEIRYLKALQILSEASSDILKNTAQQLLTESTAAGYARMRKTLLNDLKLDSKALPSYYTITKSRPQVISMDIIQDPNYRLIDDDRTREDPRFASVDEDHGVEEELMGAKLRGTYTDYANMMIAKHSNSGRSIEGNALIIDSYDGAIHSNTDKKETNVVSYSSQLLTSSTVSAGAKPASSWNILTWMQISGKEKCANIFPAIQDVYKEKRLLRADNTNANIDCYEMHDGKMIYQLTQHSLYSRKHHPMLLCKCKRGEGVRDLDHSCTIIGDSDQLEYYNRSERRWNRKRESPEGASYLVSDHCDWCDINNFGITHFGLHANLLPHSSIRFDIFHLRQAITKKLMEYFRRFMRGQSIETMDKFDEILIKIWGSFCVSI